MTHLTRYAYTKAHQLIAQHGATKAVADVMPENTPAFVGPTAVAAELVAARIRYLATIRITQSAEGVVALDRLGHRVLAAPTRDRLVVAARASLAPAIVAARAALAPAVATGANGFRFDWD